MSLFAPTNDRRPDICLNTPFLTRFQKQFGTIEAKAFFKRSFEGTCRRFFILLQYVYAAISLKIQNKTIIRKPET